VASEQADPTEDDEKNGSENRHEQEPGHDQVAATLTVELRGELEAGGCLGLEAVGTNRIRALGNPRVV
jgi:hypothetical protein